MNRLERVLFRLYSDLRALQVRWALVGGLAISARAQPRTTNDVDVAVAVGSESEAEQVVRSLRGLGYRDRPMIFERLRTIRLLSPAEEGIFVDLLFGLSGIEPEVVAAAQTVQVLPGLFAPVATVGHLLALKVLAGRDLDWADARSLLRVARERDVEQAREALLLIHQRGSVERDLLMDLEMLIHEKPHHE